MNRWRPHALDRYRIGPGDSASRLHLDQSHLHLLRARDALSSGLRLLERAGEKSPWARGRYAEAARGTLAEAVVSLASAAVHVAGLRTFTTDVVFAEHADVNLELRRLHQMTTQLWWHNSPRFPAGDGSTDNIDDDARLAELMRAYTNTNASEYVAFAARTTANVTLLAVGAAISAPALAVCLAAIGVREMLRS